MVHCLICKGEENEVIPVLEMYLKQAMNTKLNRCFVLSSLHKALMECYYVSGDLTKAIEHCEEIIKLPSAEVVYNDVSPSYFINLSGFRENFDKPVNETQLQALRYDRDKNLHKETNFRTDRIKQNKEKYAPLMGKVDWFTDDLD